MSEASPDSNKPSPEAADTPAKGSAPKNKQCPFCGDSFTSSSLGRHLDLYIKEKNPKAADGVHDVDKIRQIRSNITRRQPRRSIQKNSVSTPGSNAALPQGSSASQYGFVIGTDENNRLMINRPTWEATGVMTNIPTAGLRIDSGTRRQLSRSDTAIRKRMLEDRTRLRAAELALQEVLDSVNAASARAHPQSPFEFDFLALSFPTICLKMLPKQPSLDGAQVIENSTCCPVGPPNKSHYEQLQQLLKQRQDDFTQSQTQAYERRDLHDLINQNSDDHEEPSHEQPDFSSYYDHLSKAFSVWESTPDFQKENLWHLEALRAYNAAHDESAKLRDDLSRAETQIAHLHLQIARLNECQQPKEYTYNIPAQHPVSQETIKILASTEADIPLDRESLIGKWTSVVKDDRKYQRQLPALELADLTVPESMDIEDDEEGQEENGPNDELGSDKGDGDGDSVDAAGEDDDEVTGIEIHGVNGTATTAQMSSNPPKVKAGTLNRDVLDPSLRNDDEDAEGEGAMDVDKGDFGAEMLLADMRARARAR